MTSQVVLATAGYDHSIRFWEATSGLCYRTLQYPDSQASSHEQVGAPRGKRQDPNASNEESIMAKIKLARQF